MIHFQHMLNKLNESFGLLAYETESIVGVSFSDAPYIDKSIIDLYGDDWVEDFDFDNDFVWIKRYKGIERLRWKFPFIIKLIWAERGDGG